MLAGENPGGQHDTYPLFTLTLLFAHDIYKDGFVILFAAMVMALWSLSGLAISNMTKDMTRETKIFTKSFAQYQNRWFSERQVLEIYKTMFCTKIITELILERVGPVFLGLFYWN